MWIPTSVLHPHILCRLAFSLRHAHLTRIRLVKGYVLFHTNKWVILALTFCVGDEKSLSGKAKLKLCKVCKGGRGLWTAEMYRGEWLASCARLCPRDATVGANYNGRGKQDTKGNLRLRGIESRHYCAVITDWRNLTGIINRSTCLLAGPGGRGV